MARTVTTKYDVSEHLRTPQEMAAYLEMCIEESNGDAAFIAKVLGDLAKAKGMSQVARDAGLSRESLYKALSGERIPGFDTILKVSRCTRNKIARRSSTYNKIKSLTNRLSRRAAQLIVGHQYN